MAINKLSESNPDPNFDPGRASNLTSSLNFKAGAIKFAFGIYFFLLFLMALFPPFYLGVSGSSQLVLGVPLPIFYWIAITVLVGAGVWVLYVIEGLAGDLADEGEPT